MDKTDENFKEDVANLEALPDGDSFFEEEFENFAEDMSIDNTTDGEPPETTTTVKAPIRAAEEPIAPEARKDTTEAPTEPPVAIKTLTVLDIEGNEIQIPADQKYKWTTKKGQEFEQSLQDLQNDYHGREYSDQLAREARTSADTANNFIAEAQDLIEVASEGNADKLYLAVLDAFAKIDPEFNKDNHLKLVGENNAKISGMNDDQRALHQRDLELQAKERQLNKKGKQTDDLAYREQVQTEITKIQEELGVSQEDLTDVYQDLLENDESFKSQTDSEQLIDIRTEIIFQRYVQRAGVIITSVDSSLLENPEVTNDLVNYMARNPEISDKEISKRLANLYQTPKALDKVNNRANKNQKATGRPQGKVNPEEVPIDDHNLDSAQFEGMNPHERFGAWFDDSIEPTLR